MTDVRPSVQQARISASSCEMSVRRERRGRFREEPALLWQRLRCCRTSIGAGGTLVRTAGRHDGPSAGAPAPSIYKVARVCGALDDSEAGNRKLPKPRLGCYCCCCCCSPHPRQARLAVCSSSAAVQRTFFVEELEFRRRCRRLRSSRLHHVQRIVKRCQENRPQVCSPLFSTVQRYWRAA